jgi:hypothetical protein
MLVAALRDEKVEKLGGTAGWRWKRRVLSGEKRTTMVE